MWQWDKRSAARAHFAIHLRNGQCWRCARRHWSAQGQDTPQCFSQLVLWQQTDQPLCVQVFRASANFLLNFNSILKYESRTIDMKHFMEHQLIVKNITNDDMGIYMAKSKSTSLSAQLNIVEEDKAKGVNLYAISQIATSSTKFTRLKGINDKESMRSICQQTETCLRSARQYRSYGG